MRKTIFCVLLLVIFTFTIEPILADEDYWKLSIVPAALNKDNIIRLVQGYTQPICVMLQATDGIKSKEPTLCVEIELDMPKGIEVVHTGGRYELLQTFKHEEADRIKQRFKFKIPHNVVSDPKQPLGEWEIHSFFLDVSAEVDSDESYIITTLRFDDDIYKDAWPLEIYQLNKPGVQLENIRIGLWDYNFAYGSGKVADEAGQFLKACGINYVETQSSDTYSGLVKNGIKHGGYVHHGDFSNDAYPEIDVKGNKLIGNYAEMQAVIDSKGEIIQKGIERLVKAARYYDGYCLLDYEPRADIGFAQKSIAKFKELYNVSDTDFQLFHEYMKAYGVYSHTVEEPAFREIYKKWVKFRTWQVSEYVRLISEGIKAQYPEAKFEITPNLSYNDEGVHTLAKGYNAAAMSPYLYGIQPQIYMGYGATATKAVFQETRNFAKNVKSNFYPILLVRYAGASVGNTPERLRQQIIGSIAEGADGVILYYAHQMDAPYWVMLSSLTQEIEFIEAFYRNGTRVDNLFIPQNMLKGRDQLAIYPGYSIDVADPQWHYTAHQVGNQYCLTLFNLAEENDLMFKFKIDPSLKLIKVKGGTMSEVNNETNFQVAAKDIAFVIFEKTN